MSDLREEPRTLDRVLPPRPRRKSPPRCCGERPSHEAPGLPKFPSWNRPPLHRAVSAFSIDETSIRSAAVEYNPRSTKRSPRCPASPASSPAERERQGLLRVMWSLSACSSRFPDGRRHAAARRQPWERLTGLLLIRSHHQENKPGPGTRSHAPTAPTGRSPRPRRCQL
jgi:hypothetical protein